MTTIAIHQPNYMPWLGYFKKLAEADIFVFLDDVQYTKNSYINRVKINHEGQARWLTVPVTFNFGDAINAVKPAQPDWTRRHLDTLKGIYRKAACFDAVWADIEDIYTATPDENLAVSNRHLIEGFATRLGLKPRFEASSEIDTGTARADDRLIEIVRQLAPDGDYLSGQGGANYQDEAKFRAAGLRLRYRRFQPPTYHQPTEDFVPGLSVIDAVLNVGWNETARLIRTADA